LDRDAVVLAKGLLSKYQRSKLPFVCILLLSAFRALYVARNMVRRGRPVAAHALFARFAVDQILVVAKHRRYKSTFSRLVDRVKCCDGFERYCSNVDCCHFLQWQTGFVRGVRWKEKKYPRQTVKMRQMRYASDFQVSTCVMLHTQTRQSQFLLCAEACQ
jgi:hypothetical protein